MIIVPTFFFAFASAITELYDELTERRPGQPRESFSMRMTYVNKGAAMRLVKKNRPRLYFAYQATLALIAITLIVMELSGY